MSQHRFLTIAGALVMLFSCPKDGSAGIIEIIAEMSGPQMIGFLVECRFPVDATVDRCSALGKRVAGQDDPPQRKLRFALDGGIYFSTGRNVSGQDYGAGDVWMLAFDPMIEIQTVTGSRFALYHGVMGASYNLFFGQGFDTFTNVAFKFRPVGVVIANRLEVAYNLRIYPNEFTADEFGKVPVAAPSNKAEAVHGIVIGYRW